MVLLCSYDGSSWGGILPPFLFMALLLSAL